jgi:transposase
VSDLFGVKGRRRLRELEFPLEEQETVDGCLRHIEFLEQEIAEVERRIASEVLDSADIRRFMTVPGVNVIAAATFMAAVGDIRRFRTQRQLVGYLDLDPKVRQSGIAPAKSGRISKQGSASARLGTGRGSLERGSPARPAARVLSAAARPSRQPDRHSRRHAQARVPVLVPADPRRGLRPPAAIADREEAPPARGPRGRPDTEGQAHRGVGQQTSDV